MYVPLVIFYLFIYYLFCQEKLRLSCIETRKEFSSSPHTNSKVFGLSPLHVASNIGLELVIKGALI
jgi:hypothetical protein